MNLFNHIKSQLTILDVVGEYTQLKKAGSYYKGHCPFHNEKTASFTVSPHKGIFYCFGCHKSGDVISFIEAIEQCSALEAAYHLADRYSIAIDEITHVPHESPDEKKRYTNLCALFAQWSHRHLLANTAALHYLYKRGISQASMQHFSLGYFPRGLNSIQNLMSSMQQHNYLPIDLVEAGIISQGKTVFYSPFEDRIIFPIKDHLGRYCGFGGRIFKTDDERPKYYNSRENAYFIKGSLLFGLDSAKQHMQQAEAAFLVEGYTDCIAMVQHGFANTIATLGTACTQEHLQQLSRYIQHVYVVYDSDRAGTEAILRLTNLCWNVSMELSVIQLPEGEDPASFLAKKGDFSALLKGAKNIFHFFIDTISKDFQAKPLQEKLSLTRRLLDIIRSINDSLAQAMLIQRASQTLGIPLTLLQKEINLAPANQQQARKLQAENIAQNDGAAGPQERDHDQKLEKKLFFAIINNMQLFNITNRDYLIEYLPSPFCAILNRIKKLQEEGASIDFMQLFDSLDSYEKQVVSKLLMELQDTADQETFDQLLLQFHKKNWRAFVQETNRKLARAKQEGNHVQEATILQQFLEIKKKIITYKPPINGGKR